MSQSQQKTTPAAGMSAEDAYNTAAAEPPSAYLTRGDPLMPKDLGSSAMHLKDKGAAVGESAPSIAMPHGDARLKQFADVIPGPWRSGDAAVQHHDK